MKVKFELLAVLLVYSIVSPALGQSEKITLYADAAGSDCSITDTTPGLIQVHIFHLGSGDRRVSVFTSPKPNCWTGATWLGDDFAPGTLFIGTTQTSLTLGYNAGDPCPQLPVYIGKMNYFGAGTGQPCCEYPVLPAPAKSTVIAVDCQEPFGNQVAIGAGKVTINETEDCPCNPPLAVEETTWGAVKALYR